MINYSGGKAEGQCFLFYDPQYINMLFVLRGLMPRPLGRLKKVLNPEYKYLIRTTYPVPLERGC
jgi:hypothetical protein